MSEKKLLIVSYFFAPMNRIGAVRPTKLAKYLTRMGYEVTVVCGRPAGGVTDPLLERDRKELHAVHEIEERNWIHILKGHGGQAAGPAKASAAPAAAAPKSRKAKLADALYRYLAYRADRSFAKRAIRFLKRDGQTYDAVFASYGPISSQRIARYCKRHGVAKRWVADFRDEARYPFRWQKGAEKRYTRFVRKEADAITAAAPSYLKMTSVDDVGAVLYNGFDREDLADLPAAGPDASFTLLYCGTLFPGTTDLSPVLRCLHELEEEGLISQERVCVQYMGMTENLFWEQARTSGMADWCQSLGFVDRRTALTMERRADVLLLAARNDKSRYGVIKGKYLEYLMLGRPIIACVTGDVPDSEIARHIRQGRVGCCCEKAAGEASLAGLRDYVLALYHRALAGEPLLTDVNEDYVNSFDYRVLAKQLDRLLQGKS